MKLNIEDKETKIKMDYNYAAYREIKKAPTSQFDYDSNTWQVANSYMKQLLKYLEVMNLDVKDTMIAVNNSIDNHKKYMIEENEEIIKTVRLKIVKENRKSVALKFDYDPKVLQYIKATNNRKWNNNDKSWTVRKEELEWIYEKLNELGYVEMSDLEKHLGKDNKITLSLDDFPNRSPKLKEYKHQTDTAESLIKYKKAINALEAGLGKTLITNMISEKLKLKTLIVCPASAKYNWQNEIKLLNSKADVTVLDSKSEWKDSQYVIINYDILGSFYEKIIGANFDMVAFDEAHKIRGIDSRGRPNSKRARLSLNIAKKTEYVYPITATPFINYVKDIFNLLVAIEHPMTKSWYSFSNTYCGAKRTEYGVKYSGSSNREQLNERLYPNYMIRLRSEDYLDLPERTRSFIPVKINDTKYRRLVNEYLSNRKNFKNKGEHLVELNAMMRILALEKSKFSIQLIKDSLEKGEPVVFFTNYIEVIDKIAEKFDGEYSIVTGDVKDEERDNQVKLFQSGDNKVFLGTIEAAGEIITLTKSHEMIVNDMHWSPVLMVNQMEKRIHRMSQTQPCNIRYVYAQETRVDEMMVEMLEKKLNDASLIIDGKKETFADELIKNL